MTVRLLEVAERSPCDTFHLMSFRRGGHVGYHADRHNGSGGPTWRLIVRSKIFLTVLASVVVSFGCGGASAPPAAVDEVESVEISEEPAPDRHDVVYVCNCGDDCDCGTMAVAPGTCSCGTELVQAHLVKVEENEALLCTCGGDCDCTIDAEDESKCSCGNQLRRVSFDGTGLYYCKCGGSCTCNYVATAPGKCSCGMELTAST